MKKSSFFLVRNVNFFVTNVTICHITKSDKDFCTTCVAPSNISVYFRFPQTEEEGRRRRHEGVDNVELMLLDTSIAHVTFFEL